MAQSASRSAVQIVAIVNSFNRVELLRWGFPTLVDALIKCGLPAAIVVFEAGSSDGSPQWLEQFSALHPEIEIVVERAKNGQDTSFSAGVNAACQVAAQVFPATRFYYLFETDNWLASETPLIQALSFLRDAPDDDVCAAGFTVKKQGGESAGFGSRFPRPIDFVVGPQLAQFLGWDKPRLDWKDFQDQKWSYCEVVYTSPLLISRADWELSDGLDAKTFPFSECDLDLAWRLWKKGRKMAVLQSGEVVHDNKSQSSAWSETRTLHFHRARFRLLKRFYGSKIEALRPFLVLRHGLECLVIGLLAAKIQNPRAKLIKRAQLLRRAFNGYR